MKYIFIIIASSLLLFSCENEKANSNETQATNENVVSNNNTVTFTEEQIKVANIKTGKVEKISISQEVFSTGVVESSPQNMAKISVPASAFIDKISVKHGAYVKKGQTILTFKHNDFIDLEASYLKIKNELKFKKEEYDRQKKLYNENAVSKKKFNQVELDYNIAKTQKKALEQKLIFIGLNPDELTADKISSNIKLIAPFSGYIDEIFVTTGQYVEPTEVLFELINPSNYNIMLSVYAKYRGVIKVGDKVQFRPCDNCEPMYAKIYSIGQLLDDKTKTFKVHAQPEDANSVELMSGAYINAKILVNNIEVTALPKSAVITNKNGSFVFVDNSNGNYKLIKVETGESNDKYIEVKNADILEGKDIVVSGSNYLYSNLNE